MNNMTTEKAIYQLTDLIKDRESFCHRDDFDDMFLQDIEALKVGIAALEKQMPKKVFMDMTGNGEIFDFVCSCCPNCSCTMSDEDKPKYCPDCGQALDWSDENG